MFGRLKARRSIYGALVVAALSGCSTAYYAHTKEGKFWGATCLEWRNQHEFAFHQNSRHPFYFERANGEKIIPKSIYTDGGSIPRALWAFRGYSPWEYGPAFIIHDWLFIAHHCRSLLRGEAALAGWRLPTTTSRNRRRTTRAVATGTQAPRPGIASDEGRTEENSSGNKGAIARASAGQVNPNCPSSIVD